MSGREERGKRDYSIGVREAFSIYESVRHAISARLFTVVTTCLFYLLSPKIFLSVYANMFTNIVQTRQAGSLLTVDIQTCFHLIIGILDMEVAEIQSALCADWHSKHLSVYISGCPSPDYVKPYESFR